MTATFDVGFVGVLPGAGIESAGITNEARGAALQIAGQLPARIGPGLWI